MVVHMGSMRCIGTAFGGVEQIPRDLTQRANSWRLGIWIRRVVGWYCRGNGVDCFFENPHTSWRWLTEYFATNRSVYRRD